MCKIEENKLNSVKLLVAPKLKTVDDRCFCYSMLEKLVGDKLEFIGKDAFKFSHFLKEINLKNVKEIGATAFIGTSLQFIKNNFIEELNDYQFSDLITEV